MKRKSRGLFARIVAVCAAVILLVALTGCGNEEAGARQVLNDYLTAVANGDTGSAYKLISEPDQKQIPEETFNEWRNLVSELVTNESFTIDEKADKFNNYPYMGTTFSKAYGFSVQWKQKILKEGTQLTDYDQEKFMIMVGKSGDSFYAVLMLKDMETRLEAYRGQLN